MNRTWKALLLLVACGAGGVAFRPISAAAEQSAPVAGVVQDLADKAWLEEIMRHTYRWYVEERDVDPVVKAGEVIFWVREVKRKLDEGDKSRFGEVVLPQFSLLIKVKQADYSVPELNVTVKNDRFKVFEIDRLEPGERKADDFTIVKLNYQELREDLFRTRNLATFPEGELLERLRAAVRAEIIADYKERGEPLPQGTQVNYLAPLSPIANESWVFWETGRTLIRFASDIDLSNPAVWEHEKLAVKLYHLDRNVVVSLDEVSGSNAFMTRNQAGRAIFNCIVLGKRIELTPGVPAPAEK